METKEFEKDIRKKDSYSHYYYYLISVAIVSFGIYSLYNAAVHGGQPGMLAAYAPGVFLVVFGLISILRFIPRRYKITEIPSALSLEDKASHIETIKETLRATLLEQRTECVYMRLPGEKIVSHGYNLYVKASADKYYFCLIPETGLYGGLIDFGETKKYRDTIKELLSRTS